jgi:integrase
MAYRIFRKTFPQVYQSPQGYLVSARRYGWNLRQTFSTLKGAMDRASEIAEKQRAGAEPPPKPEEHKQLVATVNELTAKIPNGKTPVEALEVYSNIIKTVERYGIDPEEAVRNYVKIFELFQPFRPKDLVFLCQDYSEILDRMGRLGRSPKEAVDHFLGHLDQEKIKREKPFISKLSDDWMAFKLTDKTLSKKTVVEIKFYSRWIKKTWGQLKPDDFKKNQIDLLIRGLEVSNNTRRKYLRYIRMFFNWVKDEHYILVNPTDGIFFKPDDFTADFYDAETTKKILKYVAENEKDLLGYYALLTFAGLRPSEGARVQWDDYNFQTNELYVKKGKTNARHIILEPVASEWLKLHRKNFPKKKAPFVKIPNLSNRERDIREKIKALIKERWIQDGLRHGFGTFYKNRIKDIGRVADYMGNSADMVKRHYARTVTHEECNTFWSLTPKVVIESKE